jgi:hypothetical protein
MVLGMGGMGKTSLIAKLMAGFTNSEFKYVIWRFLRSASLSLHHAPTVEETLTDLIHILSHQQAVDLPKFPDQLISKLMQYLHQTRCLLVLDNLESILQWGGGGYYRPGFEGYGQLIRTIGESTHKSCLIIISREPPIAFSVLEKKANSVRLLILRGLLPEDGLKIFQSEGIDKTQAEWQILHNHYGGNPLILKIVITIIHFLFSSKIDLFLAQGITVFGDIYDLLDQQFQRLSDLEKTVIYSLAIHRQPLFMPELVRKIISPVTSQNLLATLANLKLRSLIECNSDGFTVQNDLKEYVSSQLKS